jgi:hypothetical protein
VPRRKLRWTQAEQSAQAAPSPQTPAPDPWPPIMGLRRAAKYLDLPSHWPLYRAAAAGRIPVNKEFREWRFHRVDLDKFFADGLVPGLTGMYCTSGTSPRRPKHSTTNPHLVSNHSNEYLSSGTSPGVNAYCTSGNSPTPASTSTPDSHVTVPSPSLQSHPTDSMTFSGPKAARRLRRCVPNCTRRREVRHDRSRAAKRRGVNLQTIGDTPLYGEYK